MKKRTLHLLFILLITIALPLIYGNIYHAEFIFDDYVNIVDKPGINSFIPSLDGAVNAATEQPNGGRWLPNLSFAVNYYLGGGNPFGFHIVNIFIHIVNSLLCYYLCVTTLNFPALKNTFKHKEEIALIATLLWAVHPLQTNAVTYIVQRMTSMSTLFYLSALLCYIYGRLKFKERIRSTLLFTAGILFWIMALKSKENTFILPAILFAYELFFLNPPDWKKDYRKLLAWSLVSLAVIAGCIVFFLGTNIWDHIIQSYVGRNFTMPERLLTESRILFFYISLLVYPFPARLNLNHDFSISHAIFSPPQTALSLAGLAVMIALIPLLFKRYRLISFAIVWFLGNLLIESTIVPLELIYEHRLYLPAIIPLLAAVATAYRFSEKKPWLARTSCILIIVLFSLWTWQRNEIWHDNIRLWNDVISKSPQNARAQNNLGVANNRLGDKRGAEKHFARAIEADPEYRVAYQSLASLYISQNRLKEAERILQKALTRSTYLNPSAIYHSLGIVAQKSGRYQKAITYTQLALKLDRKNLDAMVTLGIAYGKLGDLKKAYTTFREANLHGLETVDLYNNWGIIAFELGQTQKALQYFQKALALNPNHPESHNNLGLAYGKLGMTQKARQEMATAMRLKQLQKQ